MAFSDFKTVSEVQEKFKITYAADNFLPDAETLNPSEQFLQELAFSMQHIEGEFVNDTRPRHSIRGCLLPTR